MHSGKSEPKTPSPDSAAADPPDLPYRELVLFLDTASGFQPAVATYDSLARRDEIIMRVKAETAEHGVSVLTLDLSGDPGERDLLRRLEECLGAHQTAPDYRPAVMVTGLEVTLDYTARPGEDGLAILANANAQRESFPRRCPVPVVFWLSPIGTSVFAQQAFDLWHWRTATFDFTTPQALRPEREQELFSSPPLVVSSLSGPRKRERLAMLRDLLGQLDASAPAESRGARARRARLLFEIGSSYCSLGDARKAIGHYEQALAIDREIGRALAIDREIGDRRGEGADLGSLGLAYADLGEVRKAIGYYEQALAIDREIGDRRGEGAVLGNLGNALGNLGNAYADLGEVRKAIG